MSLEKKIQKHVQSSGVTYKVFDHIVFLEGKVNTYEEWVHLGLMVGRISGVEGVVNNVVWDNKPSTAQQPEQEQLFTTMKNNRIGSSDIIIIGGGVIGCFIARELSRYTTKILVLEKGADVGLGASRANNGMIHPGISPKHSTLKRVLNIRGNKLYDQVCMDLDVPFKRVGSLILITPRTLEKYRKKIPNFLYTFILTWLLPFFVKLKGRYNGVKKIRIIRGKKIVRIEPWAAKDVLAAIRIPSTGILDPYELTIALMENMQTNGVHLLLNTKVIGFVKEKNRIHGVVTDHGTYTCSLVINAAGVHADDIALFAGAQEYTIHPRKGVELLFNKNVSPGINHCLAELKIPTQKTTKGGGINPTVHGNSFWGPSAIETWDKQSTSVDCSEIQHMLNTYKTMTDGFPTNQMIRYFAGVRAPTFTEDFIIRHAKWVENFIHVAGIQSPGLASAPAIAEYVVSLVQEQGFATTKNPLFTPKRYRIPSAADMSLEDLHNNIKKNPAWGNIICTCEMVSEAEIVEAIHRGATSIDAVKRRTRAGMGDCQLSYCELRIANILSRELQIPLNQVVKESAQNRLFNGIVRGEQP